MKTKSKRVLICDDDAGILEILKIMLEEDGFEVMNLSQGRGIQKKIQEFKPDIILLDVWMPGIDGREITLNLKRDPELKQIPILILSALNRSEIEKVVKDTSADGYILKPFDMAELIAKVDSFLKE